MASGVTKNVTISGTGQTLTLNGGPIPISGGTSGLGILVNNTSAFSLTISIPLKVGNAQTWTNNSGNLLSVGAVDLNSTALTVNGTGNTSITGVISSSSGTVTMSGSGTLMLSGVNTYAGGTTISSGTVVINSASSLGASTGVLTLNAGTLDVSATFSTTRNITLGSASSTILVDPSQTYTTSGVISSTGTLNKTGTGTLVLSGANTFNGGANINAGILQAGSSGALGSSGTISFGGGTLQYSSSNTTDYSSRFGNAAGQSYSIDTNGQNVALATGLTSSTGTLIKTGSGTLTLSGASTFGGTTTINNGTLSLDSAGSTTARLGGTSSVTVNAGGTLLLANSSGTSSTDRINNSATMTLNGGTFNTGGLSEHGAGNNTAGIGALTLQSTSTIDMGSGASIIAFADSHLLGWTGTLNIYNWTGTPRTGGGIDELFFGTGSTGLTASQLAEIQFYSGSGTGAYGPGAMILANGEVVAIPEVRTFVPGLLALCVLLARTPAFSRNRVKLRKRKTPIP